METSIRLGKVLFYAENEFPHGLSRSGYFNKRESEELSLYGITLQGLALCLLSPINDEEEKFILDINSPETSTLYAVNLWKKYLAAVRQKNILHGFTPSERPKEAISDYTL